MPWYCWIRSINLIVQLMNRVLCRWSLDRFLYLIRVICTIWCQDILLLSYSVWIRCHVLLCDATLSREIVLLCDRSEVMVVRYVNLRKLNVYFCPVSLCLPSNNVNISLWVSFVNKLKKNTSLCSFLWFCKGDSAAEIVFIKTLTETLAYINNIDI